jgi:hypothetical protein
MGHPRLQTRLQSEQVGWSVPASQRQPLFGHGPAAITEMVRSSCLALFVAAWWVLFVAAWRAAPAAPNFKRTTLATKQRIEHLHKPVRVGGSERRAGPRAGNVEGDQCGLHRPPYIQR